MPPIEALMVGAGGRGTFAYGPYALAHPDEIRFTAVAEPDRIRRERFARLHDIPPERQFAGWEEALQAPQLADAALNCTMDRMHYDSTLALLGRGYDVLLEKPMAPTAAECVELVNAAERLGRVLQICHVLRYTAFFSTVYQLINSGRLGRLITFDHRENVSYWHMAHSFVRGLWRNQAGSAPMILAKCCHDLDILAWTTGQPVTRLASYGRLSHYRAENAPAGAPLRCTEGCPAEDACPWYAPRIYGARPGYGFETPTWLLMAFIETPLPDERWEALKTLPHGRCVYHCDNDVVDHQVISMEFADGLTGTFTMHGHSDLEGRTLRWDGTRATLYGDFSEKGETLRLCDHLTNTVEMVQPQVEAGGHGGGDTGLMRDFLRTLKGEATPQQTSGRVSLESHLLAFAAEESRLSGQAVDMARFRQLNR